MSYQRLQRFLPDRSGVMLLAIALTAALALLGFGSLAISKSEALAHQYRVRQQLETLQEQNRLLVAALDQAQHGQNIVPRAWQYYHRLPPGLTVIEGESAVGDASAQWADGPPVWVELLEQIRQSLTKLQIGVK
jgi:Flp pilus assembly protein TadG